eukprot:g30329.t1
MQRRENWFGFEDPLSDVPDNIPPHRSNQERYDCAHGSREMWPQDKVQYCRLWLAVTEINYEGLDCQGDQTGWSDEQDDASQDTLDGSSPDKPRPQEGEEALHFDCAHEDKGDWHTTKRMWCCEKWGLGCEELGNFNCNSGFWNWRKGWSVQKMALSLSIVVQHCKGFHMSIQEYCCKHEKKGCDDRLYDCSEEGWGSRVEV